MTTTSARAYGSAQSPPRRVGQVQLQPPPRIERSQGAGGVLMNAIPILGSLGSMVVVTTMGGAGAGGRQYVAAAMFLFATLGFVAVQVDRQRRQRSLHLTGGRADYLGYLRGVRREVREAAEQQRLELGWHHPEPSALPALAEDRIRLWERRAGDPRLLHVRYGVSDQPLSLELVAPDDDPVDRADPAASAAVRRLLGVHRQLRDLPAWLDLCEFSGVQICGGEEPARAVARALVCQAAAFHSPEQLRVAVLARKQALASWDWVKWLPHAHSEREQDAVGGCRMVSDSLAELALLLPADLFERPRFLSGDRPGEPHVLIVVDGVDLPIGSHLVAADGLHGLTLVDLPTRWAELEDQATLRLQLDDIGERPAATAGRVAAAVLRRHAEPAPAMLDQCGVATAEAIARRLAPMVAMMRPSGSTPGVEDSHRSGSPDLMDLLGLGDVRRLDPEQAWRRRPTRDRLRVPIGTDPDGAPVHLDLKESAEQGMGPHGLVIGATGSGKSEFLRSLVLGLALTHSPEQLTIVLVDFKGGATFAGMSDLPHVSAVITNLAQELTLVDRMQDALSGEMVRRQELLRAAGNFASVRDYEKARAGGADLEPLPSLLIVVDEFSELLGARAEFIELFVAIGRLGRSLAMHLLLASQRLEEGRLGGLESHLSFRVGLRTFSAQESRAVLGVPDAYELPAVPGVGYLRATATSVQRFKAAYVSGPPRWGPLMTPVASSRQDQDIAAIVPFTIAAVPRPEAPTQPFEPPPRTPAGPEVVEGRSLLDLAVERLRGHGPAAQQVWLPALDVPETLDALMPDLATNHETDLGLVSPQWRALGGLVVPIGTVDRPREQRRDTLTVDLNGGSGHLAVVGGPRSGKSTLLRSLVAGIALTTTPLESQFFALDLGGVTFSGLAGLPHLAGVGTRSEPDVMTRIVAEVSGIVERREAYFRANGIDSIQTYRSRRSTGAADDGWGDVFLVVDGWSALRSDFDHLEVEVGRLATRGLTFGVHLIVATDRWADLRAGVRDLFGSRIELRLGDPLDSEIDRRQANLVPAGRPGRGLAASKLHFLAALPRIDGRPDPTDLGAGVDDLVVRIGAAWRGPEGPKLRLLPELITLEQVHAESTSPQDRLLVGIDERDLAPVALDPDTQPHLLVLGEGGSGKTAVLRTLAREIVRTHTAERAQIVVVDYRRALLGEVPEDYRLEYLTSAAQAEPALRELATYLTSRIPGPGVSADQLRARSWWSGAEVFVLVDDYDLVATQQGSPVAVLAPLLAQAHDVGLHLAVTRRTAGASRALYEPVVQTLRDLATPGLLLSGSPDEGPLIANLRPAPMPPGRGRLITRERGTQVLQTAWTESLL